MVCLLPYQSGDYVVLTFNRPHRGLLSTVEDSWEGKGEKWRGRGLGLTVMRPRGDRSDACPPTDACLCQSVLEEDSECNVNLSLLPFPSHHLSVSVNLVWFFFSDSLPLLSFLFWYILCFSTWMHSLEAAGDSRGIPWQYIVLPTALFQMLGVVPLLFTPPVQGLMIAVKGGYRLILRDSLCLVA